MTYIYQLDRALLREQVEKKAHYISGKVLDVGGGEFQRYKKYFKYDSYVSMDVYEGKDIDVVGSADAIPFPDGTFDAVVSTQVFEHVKFPEKCAQEACRVLKKGGIALITIPQWNELHSEPHDYWRYTKFGLQELFERNGFETVAFEQRGGFFVNLAQMQMRFFIDKYQLHKKPFLGRIVSRLFRWWGAYALFRDAQDTSVANRKHTIGWCFVFKKR